MGPGNALDVGRLADHQGRDRRRSRDQGSRPQLYRPRHAYGARLYGDDVRNGGRRTLAHYQAHPRRTADRARERRPHGPQAETHRAPEARSTGAAGERRADAQPCQKLRRQHQHDFEARMNRAERRKLQVQQGSAEMRRAKWRCLGCERAGYRNKSKEHFWPLWITERANIKGTSLNWLHGKAHRNATVLPLCRECNDLLNTKLEIPVQHVFDSVENKEGLSDYDAELLIRWLWKYEGLVWGVMASRTDARY